MPCETSREDKGLGNKKNSQFISTVVLHGGFLKSILGRYSWPPRKTRALYILVKVKPRQGIGNGYIVTACIIFRDGQVLADKRFRTSENQVIFSMVVSRTIFCILNRCQSSKGYGATVYPSCIPNCLQPRCFATSTNTRRKYSTIKPTELRRGSGCSWPIRDCRNSSLRQSDQVGLQIWMNSRCLNLLPTMKDSQMNFTR